MPFKKGQSGNPAGRPKGIKTQKTRILEGFKKYLDVDAEEFAITMMHDAIAGGDSTILKLLIEYINGKPIQQTENTNLNLDGGEVDVEATLERLNSTESGRNILRLIEGCSDADKEASTG